MRVKPSDVSRERVRHHLTGLIDALDRYDIEDEDVSIDDPQGFWDAVAGLMLDFGIIMNEEEDWCLELL